ncbi:MAG: glutamine synthetase [Pseudonocardiales bacterium]|nr:glutamine synthetase [Pseudonocardiales bacterium]MBV9032088.1 glutamine synthetase [Pseudonocardiales bacterium]MBW0008608.1 glutamine synthetase [Pseudonocardiales bacterium]
MVDAGTLASELAADGVVGVSITWADNNGIPRSRTVPVASLPQVATRGVGVSTVLAVFDTHDAITFAHQGIATPSGDVRLVPDLRGLTRLAGQPALAWAPGRQIAVDGSPWPYDQRGVLEAQVEAAAAEGLEIRAGYEMEFVLTQAGDPDPGGEPRLAYHAPAYSPHALLAVDEFVADLLADLAANGVPVHQLHAEYGPAQVELSIVAADPVTAADRQLLARQTIHAAARAHGLRACFAPLFTAADVGNGWHLHTSVWRDGRNLLVGGATSGDRPGPDGMGWLGGLLRDLPAVAAITAPSVPSLARLRPGYFAGAYQFWGVENREAPLRYVLGSELLGADHANVELKVSDASANPYLALAAVIAAGLAGLRERADPGEPVQADPGRWSEQEREARGLHRLPTTPAEQEEALTGSKRLAAVLGEPLLGAFLAVRRSDAAWAADRSLDDVVAAHRWRY